MNTLNNIIFYYPPDPDQKGLVNAQSSFVNPATYKKHALPIPITPYNWPNDNAPPLPHSVPPSWNGAAELVLGAPMGGGPKKSSFINSDQIAGNGLQAPAVNNTIDNTMPPKKSNFGGCGFLGLGSCKKEDAATATAQQSIDAQIAAMKALANSTSTDSGISVTMVSIGAAAVALTIIAITYHK